MKAIVCWRESLDGYQDVSQNENRTRSDCKKKIEELAIEGLPAAKNVAFRKKRSVGAAARKPAVKKAAAPKRLSAKQEAKGDDGKTQVAVVKKLLRKVEQKLSGGEVKASLGDYIRLVQLHKELDEDTPREIQVSWVEAAKKDSTES